MNLRSASGVRYNEAMPRSQAQRDAQLNAMEAARGAAAMRAEAKRRADEEKAVREAERANHVHSWSGNSEYVERDGKVYECVPCMDRECNEVRETEVRF